jgi:hypothetical protein
MPEFAESHDTLVTGAIMKQTNTDEESLDFYIGMSSAAISHQDYKEALTILKKGLENLIPSEERYDIRKLLLSFYGLVTALESNLEQAYGENWEDKIEIPRLTEKEIRCHFCGKAQENVARMIAGPTVGICNECIAICNEILAEKN